MDSVSQQSSLSAEKTLYDFGAGGVDHPGSAQKISEIMDIANTCCIPVVPWGGGSGTQGDALPIFGGILLDMKRINKIIAIDEKSLTVTAEAGIIISQLESA